MYKVALCEDEEVFAAAQENSCRAILNKLNIEHELTTFRSGETFFDAFDKQQKRYDLILLDVIMGGINGIQLARKIRQKDETATFIFLTSNRDYALEGYDVNALHYLIKPIDEAVLERLIRRAYSEKFQDNFIFIKMGAQQLRIPVNDIICLETAGRRVALTLRDEIIYYSGKLVNLLSALPGERFVRCHQAFAINVKNIRELNRQEAVAVTGKRVPVSRTYMNDVKKVFMRQLGNE